MLYTAVLSASATLDDLVLTGARNNLELKSAFENWKAKLEKIAQVRSLPDPQITFAQFIQPIETRVGPQRQRIGFMQQFPWFGKLKLKGDAAFEGAESARLQYEYLKSKLSFEIKRTYYDYYLLLRTLAIVGEHAGLYGYLEGVTAARYRVGGALLSDVIRVQLEKELLEERLRSASSRVAPLISQLNVLLGRSPGTALQVEPRLEAEDVDVDYQLLAREILLRNPSLQALGHEIARERLEVRLSKKYSFPDFSLGLDYFVTGDAVMPGVTGSGQDPIAVKIAVSVPIWSNKNKAVIQEAEASHRMALHQKTNRENELLATLNSVYVSFTDAQRKKKLYRDSLLPKARQALAVTQTAFETGKTDFLNYIDSLRTLLSIQLDYEKHSVDSAVQLAALEMLTGVEGLDMRRRE